MSSLKVLWRVPSTHAETGRSDSVGATSVRVIRGARISNDGVTASTTGFPNQQLLASNAIGYERQPGFPARAVDLSAETCSPCRERRMRRQNATDLEWWSISVFCPADYERRERQLK